MSGRRTLHTALFLMAASSLVVATAPAQSDPAQRQAFFGDLHLHTSYSFDAWALFGTKTTPDEAYRFAKGETIDFQGKKVKRDHPLDFMPLRTIQNISACSAHSMIPTANFRRRRKDGKCVRRH